MNTTMQPPAGSDSPPPPPPPAPPAPPSSPSSPSPPPAVPPARPASGHPVRQVVRIGGILLAVVFTGLAGLNVLENTSGNVHVIDRREFDGRVTSLRLSSSSGDVRIRGSEGDRVVVEAWTTGSITVPDMDVVRSADGTVVEVHAGCPAPLWECGASFDVTLPSGVALDADASSGDIVASDLVGTGSLTTDSGDVRVQGAVGDRLVLHTASGDVSATDLDVVELDASTSSGDVEASFVAAPRDVEAGASSGDVVVGLPDEPGGDGEPLAYDVDTDTSSGDQVVEVSTDPTADRRIRAQTSSGDVIVHYTAGS